MQVSYGLPTHRIDRAEEFLVPGAIGELAAAAEAAGFAAVYTTDHPFPGDAWLAHGGHHALDPLVALSFAASATTTIRLHTNLLVVAYRNPFLAAKGVASLDVLSGGRVILGIGTGYLESEFEALGASFADRNERTDEAISAMRAAWSGTSTTFVGSGFRASGNTMLPRPVQHPHPPLWIGGNSRRAIRRAVELADGWCPFPNPARAAARTRTALLETLEDLAGSIAYARDHAASVGRVTPLTVAYIPAGLSMGGGAVDEDAVVTSIRALEDIGVGWVSVALPGETRDDQLAAIESFGASVLSRVAFGSGRGHLHDPSRRDTGVGASGASTDVPGERGHDGDEHFWARFDA